MSAHATTPLWTEWFGGAESSLATGVPPLHLALDLDDYERTRSGQGFASQTHLTDFDFEDEPVAPAAKFSALHPWSRFEADMPTPPEWMRQAACVSEESDMMRPPGRGAPMLARKVCSPCPVQRQCLRYALNNDITDGIWGGTTRSQRRILSKQTVAELDATSDQTVYAIALQGRIKVGITTDPANRRAALARLDGCSTSDIEQIWSGPGRPTLERYLHSRLREWRDEGEYFHDVSACRAALTAAIESLTEQAVA